MSGDSVSCVIRLVRGAWQTAVQLFGSHRGEVVDRFVGAFGVAPVDLFQGGGPDVIAVSPRPFSADQFGLVQADRGVVDKSGARTKSRV